MSTVPKVFKAAKEFNVSVETIVEFLKKKGHKVSSPMHQLTDDQYMECIAQFQKDKEAVERHHLKYKEFQEAKGEKIVEKPSAKKVEKVEKPVEVKIEKPVEKKAEAKVVEPIAPPKAETVAEVAKPAEEIIKTHDLKGPKVIGKIELPSKKGKKSTKTEEPIVEIKEIVPEPLPIPEEKTAVEIEQPEEIAEADDDIDVEETAEAEDDSADGGFKTHGSLSTRQVLGVKTVGKIDLNKVNQAERDAKKKKRKRKTNEPVQDLRPAQPKQGGQQKPEDKKVQPKEGAPTDKKKVEVASSDHLSESDKRKKEARQKERDEEAAKNLGKKRRIKKGKVVEYLAEEIDDTIRTTLASLDETGSSSRQKARKARRKEREIAETVKQDEKVRQSGIIKVTNLASPNELSGLMGVPVNEILKKCFDLGLFVSINQRLEQEHIELLVTDYGLQVEFIDEFAEDTVKVSDDKPEDLKHRAPVVTIMGHVDHGKTSLLDYIRSTTVVAGEAGGITQHIGAYEVTLPDGRQISFLDTPGHEAFTAMRARGAKVTDIVIIVVAADDAVMPQTLEAINHAQAGGVPMVFAINKIDKPGANPEKIYQQLSEKNILVEEWGGKFQVAKVSAKSGVGIPDLLEKVLLEAEILNLKANPNRNAQATIVEAELDKGKGVVATALVQTGTLRVGDIFLCGAVWGRVKALNDERGKKLKEAGPSCPAQVLGFSEVPQAGDILIVMDSEREAREIANRRQIIKREQQQRQEQKHMSLDMISQRMSEGSIQDLNIIVKGDVDGSVEALSDSLMKLSTGEVRVRVIHKAVGPITESDVILASASDAIIIGFQVRPNLNAKKLAATENIDIRLYSIIYDAINEVKAALEGMLAPEITEQVLATVEIRETFKISKVGTIAGCYVLDGKIGRNNKIRLVRDGVVVHTGELESLKRFKDDVKEVEKGFECGLNIANYNDIKVGDIVESFIIVETKRKLA